MGNLSPNFVDYGVQDRYFPSLFIGYVGFPDYWEWDVHKGLVYKPPTYAARGPIPTTVTIDLHRCITIMQHQTAGEACRHLGLIGLFFALPADNPLVEQAQEVGDACPWSLPNWENLKALESLNQSRGWNLSGGWYQHLQEAFVPLEVDGAFGYAQSKSSGLLTPTGLVEDWKTRPGLEDMVAVRSFLHDAYLTCWDWNPWHPGEEPLQRVRALFNEELVAAMVYENSD